jgi:hypothetical protein
MIISQILQVNKAVHLVAKQILLANQLILDKQDIINKIL